MARSCIHKHAENTLLTELLTSLNTSSQESKLRSDLGKFSEGLSAGAHSLADSSYIYMLINFM